MNTHATKSREDITARCGVEKNEWTGRLVLIDTQDPALVSCGNCRRILSGNPFAKTPIVSTLDRSRMVLVWKVRTIGHGEEGCPCTQNEDGDWVDPSGRILRRKNSHYLKQKMLVLSDNVLEPIGEERLIW